MSKGYFITGTDTGVGKTWSTVALMRHWQRQGKHVVGMKPVASGCVLIDGKFKNDDALLLQRYASLALPYELVNPYALQEPVAPHIAAKRQGINVDFEIIGAAFARLQALADIVLVEGVGGWAVPLNDRQDVAALAQYLDLPVVMVVGMRLGCINHARLTAQAIANSGAHCTGWLAACVEPNMAAIEENLSALQALISAPLLGMLPYGATLDENLNAPFLI